MPTGFRVYIRRNAPSHEVVDAYRKLPPANVSDCMGHLAALPAQFRLMCRPSTGSMAGAAVTVKVPGSDNLMIHKALDLESPIGDP